jgi:hypothetical protein
MVPGGYFVRQAFPVTTRVAGRLSTLIGATKVVAGDSHSCALLSVAGVGSVQCWGTDGFGQLGQEDAPPFLVEPSAIAPLYDDRVYARSLTLDSESYYPGGTVTISGYGFEPLGDGFIELAIGNGNYQQMDNFEIPRDGVIRSTFNLPGNISGGVHFLRLRVIGGGTSSNKPFTVLSADDHGNVPPAATTINALTYTDNASLNPAADLDWFTYTPSEDQAIILQTTGNTDTYCKILEGDVLVDRDDDSGAQTNCSIAADLTAGTKYYFMVRHYSAQLTGDYTISVTVAP